MTKRKTFSLSYIFTFYSHKTKLTKFSYNHKQQQLYSIISSDLGAHLKTFSYVLIISGLVIAERIYRSAISMCNRICVVDSKRHEKWPFPMIRLSEWRTFSSTVSTSQIIMKLYQQIHSAKRSILAQFEEETLSIDRVLTSKNIRYEVKISWRKISIINVVVLLKLYRLSNLVLAIICTNLCNVSIVIYKNNAISRRQVPMT